MRPSQGRQRVDLTLSPSLLKLLDDYATKKHITRGEALERILERFFDVK